MFAVKKIKLSAEKWRISRLFVRLKLLKKTCGKLSLKCSKSLEKSRKFYSCIHTHTG